MNVAALSIIIVDFIIVIIFLTLLWRISLALDLIAQRLVQMSKDLNILAHGSEDEDEEEE